MTSVIRTLPGPSELLHPRVLVVDDERQVHASLRLRLADLCELIPCAEARAALVRVKQESFDLCIVDLHMPVMNGLDFIEAARQIDPGLGFVILTGHGTEENLRRAIPLHVYDFVLKPLPDRAGLEQRLPEWVDQTRSRRRELILVRDSGSLARELGTAQIERDVEFTASESARDALLQSANLLTTIDALLASTIRSLDGITKPDPRVASVNRTLREARKSAEAATSIVERFFNSAYANRDTSPAHLGECLDHALKICSRWVRAEDDRKAFDVVLTDQHAVIDGLSGIELLLLLIPALGAGLEMSKPGTTVQVRSQSLTRLDAAQRQLQARDFLWANRKQSLYGHPGILLSIRTSGRALTEPEVKQWLEGESASPIKLPARGLLHGLTKCKGVLGLSVAPIQERFDLELALPT